MAQGRYHEDVFGVTAQSHVESAMANAIERDAQRALLAAARDNDMIGDSCVQSNQ